MLFILACCMGGDKESQFFLFIMWFSEINAGYQVLCKCFLSLVHLVVDRWLDTVGNRTGIAINLVM